MSRADPNSTMAWSITGDVLQILETRSDNRSRTTTINPMAINESVTDGILIHYYGEPDEVTDPEQPPDIDNVFHAPLVLHALSKFARKAAEKSLNNLERAQVLRGLSRDYAKEYNLKADRLGVKKSDKTGGLRSVSPISLR